MTVDIVEVRTDREAGFRLHTFLSEPRRHAVGIKPNRHADPERGNLPFGGVLVDRDLRDGEKPRKIVGGQGSSNLLDLFSDAHSISFQQLRVGLGEPRRVSHDRLRRTRERR